MLLCSFFSTALEIDDLTYTYAPDSNLLLKVTDATAHAGGFHDDSPDGTLASDPSDDYAYDVMGNMVKDENKTIRSIKYNHLNLPTFIDFGARGTISYFYDATGRKVRKVVRDNVLSNNKVTDYANGFQYLDNVIQHFPTAEGYASRLNLRQENGVVALLPTTELPVDFFTYVYNYTDHLGNIRLSYAQDPDTQQLKIVEQNHYYPFGLRHTNYSGGKMQVVKEQELKRMAPTPEELLSYKYKYNGKEWQDELGLNFYDYGARNYDAAIGRWMNVDPLAETSRRWNPYTYCYNNPLRFVDPDGMQATWKPDKNGNLIAEKGDNTATLAKYLNVSVEEAAKYKAIQNGEVTNKERGAEHQYKAGDVVTLDNRMSRSIQNSEETDGSFNCYGSVRTYVTTNDELTGENSKNVTNLFNDYGGGKEDKKTDKEMKSSLEKIESFSDAKFGETIIEIPGEHVAIYYGTDKSGTHYFYSKNGWDKPEITTLEKMLEGSKNKDYKLYNIKN